MKRYLALLLTLILFVSSFYVPVAAETADTELYNEKTVYPLDIEYSSSYAPGEYINVSVKCEQIEKKFLFFTINKYRYSVLFEVFEDNQKNTCIAQYRSKELESWFKKDLEDVFKHDDALKENEVYALLTDIAQLDCEIAALEPACKDPDTLQDFLVNICMSELLNSSRNAFSELVNEVVDDFFEEVRSSAKSAILDAVAGSAVDVAEEYAKAYKSPYKQSWWEKLLDFFASAFTSDDKPDVPDAEISGLFPNITENILDGLTDSLYVGQHRDQYFKAYTEILANDRATLAAKHHELRELIEKLDAENE